MERPETISLQPCTKRRGPQAAFLCSIEMPSFLCMISMHTMQNLETLFDKCPRCRLAKCQASSGWSAGEAVGSAETILTSAPPAQSSCRSLPFGRERNPKTASAFATRSAAFCRGTWGRNLVLFGGCQAPHLSLSRARTFTWY